MFVEEVGFYASESLPVVDLDTHIKVKRTDRSILIQQNVFCAAKDFQTTRLVGFQRRIGHKFVVLGVRPSRSVVTSTADEAVDKGIWIVVVADPAGAREVVVQTPQGVEVNLPLLLLQFDVDAKRIGQHALNF